MDASSFTFKLNVPRDAALAGLVADVVAPRPQPRLPAPAPKAGS